MRIAQTTALALLGFIASAAAHATFFEPTSTIRIVATADPALWGDFDYLLLNNFSSAGNCGISNEGLVLVRLPHTKAYAAALSAQASGKQVTVSLDDTRRDSGGNCILRWMKVLDQ